MERPEIEAWRELKKNFGYNNWQDKFIDALCDYIEHLESKIDRLETQ